MADHIDLVAVNVAQPAVLHRWRGEDVVSAIAKRPVGCKAVQVGVLGLDGDEQADQRPAPGGQIHGGRDKAIYAYPSEHLPWWSTELGGEDLGDAPFGENLSTRGATEDEVGIGDLWRWGDALLQVTQPRQPCYKLNLHRGFVRRDGTTVRMNTSGRTGWYLRVLEEGPAPAGGPIEVVEHHPAGVTVLAVHRALGVRGTGDVDGLVDLDVLGGEALAAARGRG